MTPRLVTGTAIEPAAPDAPDAAARQRSRTAVLLPVGFAMLTSLQLLAAIVSLSHLLR